MVLIDIISQFVDAFNSGEKNLGTLTLIPEKRTISEHLLPSSALRTFYELVDVDKATIGSEFLLDLASINNLPRYQQGWGIVYDTNPEGIEDAIYWNKNWIVFGYRNADAVFSKLLDVKSPVFGSIQKVREFQLASSLESFLLILTAGMTMVRDEFNYETQLDDFSVKPEVIARVREIVAQYESYGISDQFINFFFE